MSVASRSLWPVQHLREPFRPPSCRRYGDLGCVTPVFSGVPKKWDKIRIGYIIPAFAGARKWAELLCNPCVLGGTQKMGQNRNWLHHPCLRRGPKKGGIATLPL